MVCRLMSWDCRRRITFARPIIIIICFSINDKILRKENKLQREKYTTLQSDWRKQTHNHIIETVIKLNSLIGSRRTTTYIISLINVRYATAPLRTAWAVSISDTFTAWLIHTIYVHGGPLTADGNKRHLRLRRHHFRFKDNWFKSWGQNYSDAWKVKLKFFRRGVQYPAMLRSKCVAITMHREQPPVSSCESSFH
jgi:hypothetical protein